MGFLDKVKSMAAKDPERSRKMSDAAGKQINRRTGGKYAKHIDAARRQAESRLGGMGKRGGGGPDQH